MLVIAACGPEGPRGWLLAGDAPPAAAQAPGIEPGMPLDEALERIGEQLDSALAHRLSEEGIPFLLSAEAMTDRLAETSRPLSWLAAEHYSLEARLWQLQAGADRVLARIRVSAPLDSVMPEVQALREGVQALRGALAGGSAPPPEPVGRLLDRLDSMRRR